MMTREIWKDQYRTRIEGIQKIIKASLNAEQLEYALMDLCKQWGLTPKTFRENYARLATIGLSQQEKRRVRKALRMRGI